MIYEIDQQWVVEFNRSEGDVVWHKMNWNDPRSLEEAIKLLISYRERYSHRYGYIWRIKNQLTDECIAGDVIVA